MKQNFTLTSKAGNRLLRLYSALQQIRNRNRRTSAMEYQSIARQFQRLTRKVLSSPHMAAKGCSAFALSILLCGNAEAQCNTFGNADAVNPIINGKFPKIRKPVFIDIDADGDLDCFAPRYVYYYSNPLFFKNTGTNAIPNYTYKPEDGGGFTTGLNDLDYAPTTVRFGDIDGDGDYDCFMSEAYNGSGEVHIRYYENQGTATAPLFVENAAKNPLKSSYGFYFLNFSLADIDSDGDIDAYTYNWFYAEILENKGTKTDPDFVIKESKINSVAGERTYYDWNRDGLVDYFDDDISKVDYYRNTGPINDPHYVLDTESRPRFENLFPHDLVDLNGDGAPEAFNIEGGYSTLVPVPLADTSSIMVNGKRYTKFTISPSGSGYKYQAYKNGKPIKGAKFNTFIAPTDGFYSFTVTNNCGTGISRLYKVKYGGAAADMVVKKGSAAFVNSPAMVKAYPNPFTSYFTLQLPGNNFSGTVQVTDMQGRILINQVITGNKIVIGERLSKGAYVVKVLQNGQPVFSQKLLKE